LLACKQSEEEACIRKIKRAKYVYFNGCGKSGKGVLQLSRSKGLQVMAERLERIAGKSGEVKKDCR
jgi:hypothetical protein